MTASRDFHRNIAQDQEEEDPRSHTLAAEERLDRSHTVGLGRTHTQVAGVDRLLAEDTVRLAKPGNLVATGAVARTLAPVGG